MLRLLPLLTALAVLTCGMTPAFAQNFSPGQTAGIYTACVHPQPSVLDSDGIPTVPATLSFAMVRRGTTDIETGSCTNVADADATTCAQNHPEYPPGTYLVEYQLPSGQGRIDAQAVSYVEEGCVSAPSEPSDSIAWSFPGGVGPKVDLFPAE